MDQISSPNEAQGRSFSLKGELEISEVLRRTIYEKTILKKFNFRSKRCVNLNQEQLENQIEKNINLLRNTHQISTPTKSKRRGFSDINARIKFQLLLASVHLKTKIISMFYFRSERILTKDQKHRISE